MAKAVVVSVPKTYVQHTILVPWEGIALRTILGPLECHYGEVVGNYVSFKTSILTSFVLQVISGLEIPELLVLNGSLFAWFCLLRSLL